MKKKIKKTKIEKQSAKAQTPSPHNERLPGNEKRFENLMGTLCAFLEKAMEPGILYLLGVAPLVFFKLGGEFDNNPKMAFLQWGIAILAIGKLLLSLIRGEPFKWKRTPLDLPIILFYFFCWLSLLQSENVYQAALSLLHWGAAIIFYFFLRHTLKKIETIHNIFFVTALGAALVSIIGILQLFWGFDGVPQLSIPASTFSNKNMASQFVALAIPLTLGSIILSRSWWIKGFSSFFFLISFYFLILIAARSAWIATMTVFVILLILALIKGLDRERRKKYLRLILDFMKYLDRERRKKYLFITAGAVMCIFIVSLGVLSVKKNPHFYKNIKERFLSIGEVSLRDVDKFSMSELYKIFKEGSTIRLRAIWWGNTWEMVKDNKWWGVGLGNFRLRYPPYHRAIAKDWSFSEAKQVNRVHNDHLQIWVELGSLGFCAYAGMFIFFFYLCGRIFFKQQNLLKKRTALFLFLGVVSFVIIACLTFPMERAMPPIYLFMFFSLTSFLYTETGSKSWQIPKPGLVRSVIILFLVVFLVLSFKYIRKVVLSDKYFVEALALGEKGNLEKANASLEKAKESFGMWNFNISALLARNYTLQGNYNQALKEYEYSFRVHPNNTNAMLNIGYCYLKLNKFSEAEKHFKDYIEIVPDSAKVHNNLGIVCYSKKEFDKAEWYYKEAFELKSDYAEPHFNLANMYRALGRLQDAVQEYETTLSLSPDMDDARKFLVGLYAEIGDYDKAQETIAPLVKDKKKAAEGYVLQGNIYQRQGKHKEALISYLSALQLTPQNAFIYYNIGLSYYYLQDNPRAEKAFESALSLNPNIPEANNFLGQLYLSKNEDKKALPLFQKVLKLNPNLHDAQFNVGTIYLRLGKYDLAAQEYEKLLKVAPNFTVAHYNLATILIQKGGNKEAVFHFEEALKNPSNLINVNLTKQMIADLKKGLEQQAPKKQ